MRLERIDNMEQYIKEQESVNLDELCNLFKISKVTLRRDLDELTKRGTVEKVYGGVVASFPSEKSFSDLLPFDKRNITNRNSKQEIAKMAANAINDNDIIYIDTGTSTLYLVDYFGQFSSLTVVTNSILVASRLLQYEHIKTIILPGVVNSKTGSAVGNSCQEYLRQYHIQKAFMACTAINEGGAFNSSMDEYEVKRIALKQSKEHYLLVDHSKFDKSALMCYSPLNNFQIIFTDKEPKTQYLNLFKKEGITLQISQTDKK